MLRLIRNNFILLFVFAISAATASAQTSSVTLSWAANSEPDLAGYYLYYRTGSSGDPYDGTGALQGNSPIRIQLNQLGDPNHPEFTLTQLDDQAVYYFVLTAYDNENPENQSEYSNWVCNAQNRLASDFGSHGPWVYDESSWNKIGTWDIENRLVSWADGLAVDFGSNGLWSYNGPWTQLASWNPGVIAAWGNELAVDFNSMGLWNYNGASWAKIASWNPSLMSNRGSNELVVDFDS